METATWTKGDRVSVTTTTAGPEVLQIVRFVRRGQSQFVILANDTTAAGIAAGMVDWKTVVLTGLGGRVREIETQWFHRLAARGLVVKVA